MVAALAAPEVGETVPVPGEFACGAGLGEEAPEGIVGEAHAVFGEAQGPPLFGRDAAGALELSAGGPGVAGGGGAVGALLGDQASDGS
ncbi:hypothetical protein sS8_0333 [Methylocaldum marinum]|uniref:Uncharacterized protein n=1 Tax=Methylocaldum marinum TaxID=1432792 RepID=A0A286P3S9_9GAMM|nr:hypothetical protein sS8_0333 [Methylocaldum marinum]